MSRTTTKSKNSEVVNRRAWVRGVVHRRRRVGAGLWSEEPVWPWALGSVVAWAGFAGARGYSQLHTAGGAILLVCAASLTVAAVYVRNRRSDQNAWVEQVLGGSVHRSHVVALEGDGVLAVPHQCPCGAGHSVRDASGFFLGMASWVLAVQELAGEAVDAMEAAGHIRLDLWTFADDTDAMAELLLDWCHGNNPLRMSWMLSGLIVQWEPMVAEFEPVCAAAVGPSAYRRWRASSLGSRNARYGSWINPYQDETAKVA